MKDLTSRLVSVGLGIAILISMGGCATNRESSEYKRTPEDIGLRPVSFRQDGLSAYVCRGLFGYTDRQE